MARDFYIGHNRKYDIKLTFDPNKPLDNVTKKIYGLEKLAQVFLNLFLKELNKALIYGAVDMDYLKYFVRDIIQNVLSTMAKEYNDENVPDEAIDKVTIDDLEVSGGALIATLTLYSKAGEYAPVGVGYPLFEVNNVNR